MRILVICPECRRQYAAKERVVGTKFRCRCGAVVTIAKPQGHDATVVRCSSCGAPRREGAKCCEFCGADFTVREQDLGTVCPHCLARISDHAQFCDHCGLALAAEPLAIKETLLACPACGPDHRLNSRAVNGDELYECRLCAGVWLGPQTYRHLVRQAQDEESRAGFRLPPPVIKSAGSTNGDSGKRRTYLPCPVCQSLMVRQRFAFGVVVDLCKHHGIWFDADELTSILDAVRAGGIAAEEVERQSILPRDARFQEHEAQGQALPLLLDEPSSHDDALLPLVIGGAMGFLGRLFMH